MNHLLIDIGNTSLHWRIISANKNTVANTAVKTYSIRHEREWDKSFAIVKKSCQSVSLNGIFIASVSGGEIQHVINDRCLEEFSINPDWICSEVKKNSVMNAYKQPEQLGVDRWLGVLAAHLMILDSDYAAALVIDAGTAMTIDAVLKSGKHLGGSIVAGWNLQQRGLLQNTQEIIASDGEIMAFADNTASAVASGALLALLGAIQYSCSQLEEQLDDRASYLLVLSGGDSGLLFDSLNLNVNQDILCVDNIVLDGLQSYLS